MARGEEGESESAAGGEKQEEREYSMAIIKYSTSTRILQPENIG